MPARVLVMQQPQRSAVLYARVSSKEQEQGYSIAAQQELLRSYAAQQGLFIQREFFDAETAKSTGRPAFSAMLSVLQKDPRCRVLLVEKTDRLYRNIKDWLTVDELDIEIHLVKENVVLTKDSRSSEKFMHGIKVLMAKNYIDNLSEEVRKGLRTKAAQGLYPSFAPPGYMNTVRPDGKHVIVPDPVFGPIVTSLFGWFATGEYSLKALARKAWEEGFRFRKSESKVPVTTLHKILRKRIYTGEFEYGGVTYQGSHAPLVAREVWERVQEILDGRHEKKHRKMHHSFPFSGLVSCGHCGCSLVGEMKKQRYVYYHCTGYRGKCQEPYTREEALEEQFADGLRELVIPPVVLTWLQAELVASDCTERAAREQETRRQQREVERLQARLDVLYDDRLDGRIDAATYDRRAREIREHQQRARQQASAAQAAALPPVTEALDLMAVTSKAAELFLQQPAAEQRRLLHVVLREATWKSGELRMSLREPFERLRLSNSATHGNNGNFGGDTGLSGIWRRGGDSNPR